VVLVRKTPTRRADDGVNKAVVPGKSAEDRKAIAWEMPDVSGASAVNTGVYTQLTYAHTRLRVHWAPGIPRALFHEGREIFRQASGAMRGETANACPVIARSACDEAIQLSILPRDGLLR
jgi:hypothetical protein